MGELRLLVVQTGSVDAAIRELYGDYPAWFARALEGHASVDVLRAHAGERLDEAAFDRFRPAGLILTGSPLSVTAREPWMMDLGAAALRAGERGVPVLGVCFGHQLLAAASGGTVVRNPRGREVGTVSVQLTAAGLRDPLFTWAGGRGAVECLAIHEDAVAQLPDRVTLLATNENTPAQALRFSETVAAVQFHPEHTARILADVVRHRAPRYWAEGLDPEDILAKLRDTPAVGVLHAFAEQAGRA